VIFESRAILAYVDWVNVNLIFVVFYVDMLIGIKTISNHFCFHMFFSKTKLI